MITEEQMSSFVGNEFDMRVELWSEPSRVKYFLLCRVPRVRTSFFSPCSWAGESVGRRSTEREKQEQLVFVRVSGGRRKFSEHM